MKILSVKQGKGQLALNSVSGWIANLVSVITGFILLPYIVSRLGAESYGIYQLARAAVVFFMFLQLGMGPTLVRYFSRVIARSSYRGIAQISSTAQFLLGGLGFVAAVFCICFIPVFIKLYEILPQNTRSTVFLLVCMAGSLFLNMLMIVPKGMIFGLNRYDISNIIGIAWSIARIVCIMSFFSLIRPSVAFIGLSYLICDLFRFIVCYWVAFKKIGLPFLFSIRYVKKTTLRSIFSFSMLNLVNSVAQTVVFQGPILIIGKFLGAEMVTAFAPALVVSNSITGFLGQTVRPLVPVASQDRENNKGQSLGYWAIVMGKVSSFVGFGIILLLAVFGPEIIRLWLGVDFVWIWGVVVVMASGVAISQIQAANYFLALGGGDIKPTVYSQVVMAFIVISGTFAGVVFFGWQLFEVALFIGGSICLRNTIYLANVYARQLHYNYFKYMKTVYIMPGVVVMLCVAIGWGVKYLFSPGDLNLLLLEIFVVAVIYVLIWCYFLVSKFDRKRIIDIVVAKLNFYFRRRSFNVRV